MKDFNSSGELFIQDGSINSPGSPVNKKYVDSAVSDATPHPIRVDTSVGTRVFAGDTMVSGDTGWRDVTPVGYTGSLSARRVGEMVMVRLAALAPPEDAVIPTVANLPAGFRSSGRVVGPVTKSNSLGTQGRLWIEGGLVRVVVGTGPKIDDPFTPSHQYTGVEIYPTSDPWPTSLPGTPA